MQARRPLPPPTLAALYPPIAGYRYFDAPGGIRFNPQLELHAQQQAWWLSEHALLAYAHARSIQSCLASNGWHCSIARDCSSGSSAHVALGDDWGLIAFRGTEALKPGDSWRKISAVARDWWTDAQIRKVRWSGGGEVHRGFLRALDGLWPQLRPALTGDRRWWLCGHSLGGALATLAATRVLDAGARLAGSISFGQPRVGDDECAAALARLPLLRVVNACDLVPEMPPETLGYRHAGKLLHLDASHRQNYARSVRSFWSRLPGNLRHGIGALTPIELRDHAPLHYAIKCFNAAWASDPPSGCQSS
ncbi:MAG: lipase family protein [Lysobacterales bacterium]